MAVTGYIGYMACELQKYPVVLSPTSTGWRMASRHQAGILGCIKLAMIMLHSVLDVQSPSMETILEPIV
jgi:hypothetical protein